MNLYRITGFQDAEAPHWSVAYIEAESPTAAIGVLASRIGPPGDDDLDRPDTVWGVTDRSEWTVEEAERPLTFILGGGCR